MQTDFRFISIDVIPLACGKVLGFDLYQANETVGRVRCHNREEIFSQSKKNLLLSKGKQFFILDKDREKYYTHLENRLVSDAYELPNPLEVVTIADNISRELLRQTFINPDIGILYRVEKVVQSTARLIISSDEALSTLLRLAKHDQYTYTHSCNVGILSLGLCKKLNESGDNFNIERLSSAFFFHDIGKHEVRIEILNKPSPLDNEEKFEMYSHVVRGLEFLKKKGLLDEDKSYVVGQHHERMDGKGYPHGLCKDGINPVGQVCAIADVYDALTSDRPYRKRLTPFAAINIMREEMNSHFNANYLRNFLLMFKHLDQLPVPADRSRGRL